jgi:hypothetical protein
MDPFAVIILGGVGGLLLALLLIGRFSPGSGADQLDWKPTRSVETEIQNEIDDLDQMLEAANRRRRARGDAELTEADLHARVSEDLSIQLDRTGKQELDEEMQQVLEMKNRRRRKQGLPDMTIDELRATLGQGGE